ncbi:DUF4870 domain-containing protein [Mariniluteicoccus flavus]
MSTQFPHYRDYLERPASSDAGPTAAYANPTVAPSQAYAEPQPQPAQAYAPAFQHPTLDLLVSTEQRERAESFLQEAYADGRLTHAEFEVRIDQVMGATNRRELNQAFYGLVQVPSTSQALGLHPAYRPSLMNQGNTGRTGKAMASLAHFSSFFTWFFGPLVMYMLGTQGSYAKRQAAQAFNFQIYTFIGGVLGGIVAGITGIDAIMAIGFVGWVVLNIVGGVKASQGEDWVNPVNKMIPWKPVSER